LPTLDHYFRMRQIVLKIGWVFVIAIVCFSSIAKGESGLLAEKGILDLRDHDLFARSVEIKGEWGFFWNELLSPDSLRPATVFVSYPKLWSYLRLDGRALPSQGYATYTLTILLPEKRPPIGLDIPDVYCAYKLYVNGKVQSVNGETGRTPAEARPFWTRRTIALPPGEGDTLVLVFQISNFWHSKGGPYKAILIGDKDMLFKEKNQSAAYDFMLAGCFFMGGLFFLGLYLFGRHDKTTLYFSLFCVLYSYRRIGTGSYVLHSVFTDLNPFLTIRLEYLALTEGIALAFLYTKSLYPEDAHRRAIRIMVWFCHVYSALVIFTSPVFFTSFLDIYLQIMFGCLAYIMYVYFRAARMGRSGSLYALLGALIMIIMFLLQDLNYFGLIPPLEFVQFTGYIAFFFFQSLALSHRFAQTFKRATSLAQQGFKAKSEFLSTMSHEIRTPLNAVIGMTHLLLRDDPRADQKENLDLQLFSANNLLSIVNNILDYSKIEEGKVGFEYISMDLAGIAGNIVAGLKNSAEEKGISLLVNIDERLKKRLIGDPTRTTQVISNLVHNAIKFTGKGFVRLSLKVDHFAVDSVTVTISVEDTGIGIPFEKQKLIFERFTQADSTTSRSFGGAGLGLAITKRILELQGVALQLKSEPGKGSSFYFTQTFPISPKPEEPDIPEYTHVAQHNELLKGISLLLVEDKRLNVIVVKSLLEGCGAIVDVAVSGQEALEKLDANRHKLVLMDLQMPEMDGYQTTILLRERGETLPIIAFTASSPEDVEKEAFAAGITDLLTKPFDPPDLYRIILRYII
jgi:signal transduction histidine kinase